jgi:hypothetical protein
MAGRSTVATRHSSLPLHRAPPLRITQVLDSGQGNLAITAPGPLGGLAQTLRFEDATRGANRTVPMLFGVVRVASALAIPTLIRHFKCCNCRIKDNECANVKMDEMGEPHEQNA